MLNRLGFALFVLLAATAAGPVVAEQLVQFPAAATAGADTPLQGYLTRPVGNGPFPLAIVLHSCLGLRPDRAAMARDLASAGYASLFVDDFATRGLTETCSVDFPEGLADAYGALHYASQLDFIDRKHIVALGYSQGAATALEIAAGVNPDRGSTHFAAVAAYYPACEVVAGAPLPLPTLVLIGARDTVTPAAACAALRARQPHGVMQLHVIDGAGHVFDDPAFAGGKSLLGMWLQYDAPAAATARAALHAFVAKVAAD